MNEKQIISTLKKYEARSSMNQIPVIWKSAKDSIITDVNNKTYIDFTSGIFVSNCGNSATINALRAQLNKDLIYAYDYPTEIRAKLVEKLVHLDPKFIEKVFLLSTGAEATECACKLMRNYNKDKPILLSFFGSMHGKTMLAEQLKGHLSSNRWAHADNPINVYNLPFPQNDKFEFGEMSGLNDWKQLIGGIIIESYQGFSARFYPKPYIQELVKWARKNDIPVCFDEVQGGFWRTGKLFAYQHYEVEPDLICVGKGLGNGMPISAVMGRKKLLDLPSDLTSTHSGNALCCASALKSLELLEKLDKGELENKSKQLQFYLFDLQKAYSIIQEVNCKGLVAALIFKSEEIATKLCQIAAKKGLLLVHTARESVKIGPSLTITKEILHKGLGILEESLREIK